MEAVLNSADLQPLTLEEMRDTGGGWIFVVLLVLLLTGCENCPGDSKRITGPG